MEGRFLFLGTGASMGIPVIGCDCRVCQSAAPQNKRLRPAGMIELMSKTILLDVGPDFRQQALKFGIQKVDALLLTHGHFDHIGGLDDLRVFYFIQKMQIPCLLSQETLQELKMRCHYLFRPVEKLASTSAQLKFYLIDGEFGVQSFQGIQIHFLSYWQGATKVTGFRIGDFAYVSDIREYPAEIFSHLKGLKTLVVSALRHKPSPVHFSVEEAVEFARKVGAKKTWFTHIAHELEHFETNEALPNGIELACDGLECTFSYEGIGS